MIILETKSDLEIFYLYWGKEPCFIYPVWCDLDKHPMNNTLSFLYIRFRNQETDDGEVKLDFIVPLNHNDCINIDIDLSTNPYPKWVYDKKGLLQTDLGLTNMFDISSHLFFKNYSQYPNGLETNDIEVLTNFYHRNGYRDNLGKIIPIMKWSEVLRTISDDIEYDFNDVENHWVDDVMIPILSDIEQNGFKVDRKKFIDRWPVDDTALYRHDKQLKDDVIYTEYNPYTLTSRPSNRHGGINFGALNKHDGTRSVFVPRNGNTLIGFDYDAYHIRLIGKLIGYPLPETSCHQWLADQYGIPYEESKGRTFKNLYGGISDEDKNIEFFKLTDDYIQQLWGYIQNHGYITTHKHRRIYLEWIENPTPQKIFNYFLQSMETEFNMDISRTLIENGYGKYLVLYQYDSFTFDIPNDMIKNGILKDIKEILEKNGFPVHGSYGNSFDKL